MNGHRSDFISTITSDFVPPDCIWSGSVAAGARLSRRNRQLTVQRRDLYAPSVEAEYMDARGIQGDAHGVPDFGDQVTGALQGKHSVRGIEMDERLVAQPFQQLDLGLYVRHGRIWSR